MSDYDLAQKLEQLSLENLATVFFALLLHEQSINHFDHALTQSGGQLIDSFGNDATIGDGFKSGIRCDKPSEGSNVGMGRAA